MNYFKASEIELTPTYMVGEKTIGKEGEPAKWIPKKNLPEVTQSWHNYQCREMARDFVANMFHCSETPYDSENIAGIPTDPYEFPNGFHNVSTFSSR